MKSLLKHSFKLIVLEVMVKLVYAHIFIVLHYHNFFWEIGLNLIATCLIKIFYAVPTRLTSFMNVDFQASFPKYHNLFIFKF